MDYFQLSAIVKNKNAAIITLIHVFWGTFDLISVVQIRENEIGELKNRYTFSFMKNYQFSKVVIHFYTHTKRS